MIELWYVGRILERRPSADQQSGIIVFRRIRRDDEVIDLILECHDMIDINPDRSLYAALDAKVPNGKMIQLRVMNDRFVTGFDELPPVGRRHI